ncbi:hypothetical protein ISN44_As07g016490 [Arabidopsis suecica]|uniref:DUF1204 domain-containing protein n=1 Tax=Arabidopsis suecica TaxID=45249 RepID=A0A8T2BUK0_ARASU|nr:hypothetical protein ISN44_As07g016490 [Arabidopsis suecica]
MVDSFKVLGPSPKSSINSSPPTLVCSSNAARVAIISPFSLRVLSRVPEARATDASSGSSLAALEISGIGLLACSGRRRRNDYIALRGILSVLSPLFPVRRFLSPIMSSSIGSFDSVSDHLRSRTSDDSYVRSVDNFLNRSISNSRGRRSRTSSGSSVSSVARVSRDTAELQRRELLCRTGAAGTSADPQPVTTMCLRDEDSDAASVDEDDVPLIRRKSASARAARPSGPSSNFPDHLDDVPLIGRVPTLVGFVQPSGPAPGIPDYLRPTTSTSETVELSLRFCNAPTTLNTLVPNSWDRPWTAPPGYLCVYEKHITDCGLTFPIPAFLLQYASRRKMAFAQLSPAAIRNAYGLIRLAAQCGVEPRCSLYEELTTKKNFGKSKPGLVYTQSSLTPKLVVGAKSKTNDWLRWYFFVKIDNDSAGDVVVTNYHGWTISPVSCPKILDPYPERLRDDVKKILALCPYTWPNEEDPVRRPSTKPKGTSRRKGPSRTRKANKTPASLKIMGKLNVDAVGDYSARYKKRSAAIPGKTSREEDEALALGKRLSLAEYEAKERDRRPSRHQDRREEGNRRDRRGHDADRSDVRSDADRERREKEVAEARSAKLPVAETSRDVPLGSREVVLYDDSQVEPTRKRAADESETTRSDPAKKQRTAWVPDYRWRYDYNGRDAHISTDSTSCAELFRKIYVGPSPFFELQDMYERTAFTDAAKKTVAAVAAIDRMAYMYERRLRVVAEQNTASKEHQRALAAETKRAEQASKGLESANSEVQLLREEVAKLKEERDNALSERERSLEELSKSRDDFKRLAERSRAEEARLRERRTEFARINVTKALKEAAEEFQKRLDGIQRHFTTRDEAYPKFLDYNQAIGSVNLLKALVETGEVALNSEDVIERLEADAEVLKNEVNAFDIAELEEGWNDVGTFFKGPLVNDEFAPSVEGVDDEVTENVEVVDQVVGDGNTQVGDLPQDEPACDLRGRISYVIEDDLDNLVDIQRARECEFDLGLRNRPFELCECGTRLFVRSDTGPRC